MKDCTLPKLSELEEFFKSYEQEPKRYAKLQSLVNTLKEHGFTDNSPVHVAILEAIRSTVEGTGEQEEDCDLFDSFSGSVTSELIICTRNGDAPAYECPFPRYFGEPIDYAERLTHALDYIKEHGNPSNNE